MPKNRQKSKLAHHGTKQAAPYSTPGVPPDHYYVLTTHKNLLKLQYFLLFYSIFGIFLELILK
jgi:hypothetical protein